ncbi:MAG TPA: von Willebrand factor type A domain-containing protein, partial [Acholeplasma sp.]|nr:von Willebrand factor type A domain-containing protein [Acholeplasma sp.]
MKKTATLFMFFLGLALLSGCGGGVVYDGPNYNGPTYNDQNDLSGETHENIIENEFVLTQDMPVSTFSTDVDTASYSNIRRMLNSDTLPDRTAV